MKNKKALTLSETLVAMAVLGVIGAFTIPLLNDTKPDKDRIAYTKGMYNVQAAVSSAMDSDVFNNNDSVFSYWKDAQIGNNDFCNAVAKSLNTVKIINCNSSSYDNPNFTTADGLRYWGFENKVFTPDTKDASGTVTARGVSERVIFVDRTVNAKELKKRGRTATEYGLKIRITYDGKVYTPSNNSAYNYENSLLDATFDIKSKH